jgi:hypothetical protein
MVVGYCISTKSGHDRVEIDTEQEWTCWKCVDIELAPEFQKDRQKIMAEIMAKDYFGVCNYCKDFEKPKDQKSPERVKPEPVEKPAEKKEPTRDSRFGELDIL